VPARLRNLLGTTQGQPHVTRRHTGRESVGRRAIAELGQHGLTHDDPPVAFAEDLGDGAVELADLQGIAALQKRRAISG
jgi:hypothetical protein